MSVWSSEVTASMVKGWSDEAVQDLIRSLNEAVERTIDDLLVQHGLEWEASK